MVESHFFMELTLLWSILLSSPRNTKPGSQVMKDFSAHQDTSKRFQGVTGTKHRQFSQIWIPLYILV